MSFEREEPTGSIEGIDADALLSEVEGGNNREIPMHGETAPAESAPASQEQPKTAAQAAAELAFKYGEQEIKVPYTDPRLSQWASQGYDYAQKMQAFKAEQARIQQEWSEREKTISPYKTIDEFAKQNPEWWAHVQHSWEQRSQGGQAGAPGSNPEFETLRKELNDLKQFKTSFEQEKIAQKQCQEDQALESEMKSIREKHADLDWQTPDADGLTLEARVVKHAVANGINSFRAAFRDYHHDHFEQRWKEQGKEAVIKDVQKRTKLGIIGESPTSKKGPQPPTNFKKQSYDDLMREAKEELGIA